jgi:hypothetical protein
LLLCWSVQVLLSDGRGLQARPSLLSSREFFSSEHNAVR